jgi:hypothetical protein
VVNGHTRNIGNSVNYWESDKLLDEEFIQFIFDDVRPIDEIRIAFDSNLTREIRPSMDYGANRSQTRGVPRELVKDYRIEFMNCSEIIEIKSVRGNYQRVNLHKFNGVKADSIKIVIEKTNGLSTARIFDVKIY